MAKISCEVYNCSYNCDGGCGLDSIKVSGKTATVSDETVCASFEDKHNCTKASCGICTTACNNSDVECSASNCKYNSSMHCTADRISVGCEDACCCSETECKTFNTKH